MFFLESLFSQHVSVGILVNPEDFPFLRQILDNGDVCEQPMIFISLSILSLYHVEMSI